MVTENDPRFLYFNSSTL